MIKIMSGHFKPIRDYVHKCTSYYLYKQEDIANAEPVAVYEKSKRFKNLLVDNIEIPENETWYCKIIMHMGFKRLNENGEDDDYNETLDARCGVIERVVQVMDQREETSRMLLKEEVQIDTPFISVDRDEIFDRDLEYFTVKSSTFRGKGDGHAETHWVFEDIFGNTIFASLGDRKNLTSITVSKEEILKGRTSIKIICWHSSVCGIMSPKGELNVILGSQNFDIISDLYNLPATTDYRLTLRKVNPSKPTGIIKIEVKDAGETETHWSLQVKNRDAEVFILPWNLFSPSTNLMVLIYVVDEDGVMTIVKRRLSVRGIKVHDIESIQNKHNLTFHTPFYQDEMKFLKHVTTMQIRQGNLVPMPHKDDNKLHLYEVNAKTLNLRYTKQILPGVSVITNKNEDTLIRLTANDYLIIDTLNENDKPVFLVYRFDIARQTFEFSHSKVRTDETYPTGRNGSLVQTSTDEFFYLPPNTGTIRKYNFVTNSLTVMANSGIKEPNHGVLLPMRNGRLLIFAGNDFMSRTYIIDENRFMDGVSIRPQSFVGRELVAIQLNNGSTLIVKREHQDNDRENDVLYFDYSLNKFVQIGHKFDKERFPSTYIELLSGGLLLASDVDEEKIVEDGTVTELSGTELQYFN